MFSISLNFSFIYFCFIQKEYFKLDNVTLRMKFENLTVSLHNLFKNNKELSKIGNELINLNIDIFTSEIFPVIERSLSDKFLFAANEVFKLAPFNEFFPEN